MGIACTDFLINCDFLLVCLPMQSHGLKDDRNRPMCADRIHLTSVEADNISFLTLDESGRHEGFLPQCFPSPSQHLTSFALAEEVYICGVHVDGVHQSRAVRSLQVFLETPRRRYCHLTHKAAVPPQCLSPSAVAVRLARKFGFFLISSSRTSTPSRFNEFS